MRYNEGQVLSIFAEDSWMAYQLNLASSNSSIGIRDQMVNFLSKIFFLEFQVRSYSYVDVAKCFTMRYRLRHLPGLGGDTAVLNVSLCHLFRVPTLIPT